MTTPPDAVHPPAKPAAVCRECFAALTVRPRTCPHCAGRRLLAHPELFDLSIGHLDCDAFYASVEKRDRPELRDKPVIIGGGTRGVVSTACYIARLSGVRSAMPMFKALKACPDAVVIKPNMAKYVAVSREIRALMDALTPLVQPLSLDEAFLDLTGTERLHGAPPAVTLAKLAARIEREIGVSVSIGLSHNKFLAKVGSDLDKPRGFAVIGRAETLTFLAEQPVGLIWGVGPAFQARLKRDGITHIRHVQAREEAALIKLYGSMGRHIWRLAHGLDARAVEPHGPAKSVSNETTFNDDVADLETLRARLWPLCEKLAGRMKAGGMAGQVVSLKLKSADFKLRSRQRRLASPTQMAHVLYEHGLDLLAPEIDGTAYRLIGIGLSDLSPAAAEGQIDLLAEDQTRRSAAERAMDLVRGRFGDTAIGLGRGIGSGQGRDPS